MRNPRQVAVVGVTGYSGLELARILLRHPALPPPVFYVRETTGAKCLAELFPQFRGWGEAPLRPLSLDAITSSSAGAAFLATPHEVSAELAPALIKAGLRVVDLSGAFRFHEAETFTSWYKLAAPHAEWLTEAVYGIPELYSSEIAKARLVANPGCYATSVILGLRPLTRQACSPPEATSSAIANPVLVAPAKTLGATFISSKWMKISRLTIFSRTATRRKSSNTPASPSRRLSSQHTCCLSPAAFFPPSTSRSPRRKPTPMSKRSTASSTPAVPWCASGPPARCPSCSTSRTPISVTSVSRWTIPAAAWWSFLASIILEKALPDRPSRISITCWE